MAHLLQAHRTLLNTRLDFELQDDFLWYITPHLWTSLAADTNSSVAVDADGHGGILVISTGDVTNNNEAGVRTTNELLLFAGDRPFYAEARLQYTEVNTTGAAVAFGFADNMGAANHIPDGGASLDVTTSGAAIYKRTGSTVWRAYSENNSVSNDTESVQTAGGSSYEVLGIAGHPVDGTNIELTYFRNGLPLTSSTNRPIKHTLAYASATEMDFGVYCKSAGGGAALTVNVDYVFFAARRAL